jgi:hypothetical protein
MNNNQPLLFKIKIFKKINYEYNMNSYYTFIFFTFILLLSNSSLAYRIYPYHYEQYQENFPPIKMMMVVPAEGDIIWPQYVVPSMNQVPDGK